MSKREEPPIRRVAFFFVHAISKITQVVKFTRNVVRSTFAEDLRALLYDVVPATKIEPKWFDPAHDPDGLYVADYRITGKRRCLLFGVLNDDQCRSATISCLKFEEFQPEYLTVVVFSDQSLIHRKALPQLSSVVGKQFATLDERHRIHNYLQREVCIAG